MGFCCKIFWLILLGGLGFLGFVLFTEPEPVVVAENGWYGGGAPGKDDTSIRNFRINVSEETLKDLKSRLENSRISHEALEDSNDFYYGFNSHYLKEVKDYWLNKYDWRKQEAVLNSFPQFTTQIEGLNIHFIRSKPSAAYKKVYPLIVVHGWPGNVQEFVKFIPILNDPKKFGIDVDFAFEVVAPSIPGYGWSESPRKTGFSQVECARVFKKLMKRLGFEKFYLQGGDWGALVTSNMARIYPDSALGLHLNMMPVFPFNSPRALLTAIAGSFFPKLVYSTKSSQEYNIVESLKMLMIESGYMHIQATKPDTVGTGLNDSPIGLAAYILEKFSVWTNYEYKGLKDGGLTRKFSLDELLTVVMIYWTQGNIVNSQRFYREFFIDKRNEALGKQFLDVPTAHSAFGNEMFDKTPVEIARFFYNIQFRREHSDGGHFAAYEEPELLAADTFAFVQKLTTPQPKAAKQEF